MNRYRGDIGMYFFFYGIVVIVYGDLIYSYGKGKMKMIGYDDFLVSIFQDWILYRLCCSKLGDILISVFNGWEKKIICYYEKKIIQEIYKDENGKLIFEEGKIRYVLYIVENNNGDVCILDDNVGVIIVVNLVGKV